MADAYMHAKLIKEIKTLRNKDLFDDFMLIGSQGPDPMYYGFVHNYHERYRFFADRMHDTDTSLLFESMFSYAKKHYSKEVYSYIVGFLCHFALDVKIHPYVYHHVGQYDQSDKATHHMRGLHLKFERSIDAMLIEHDTGKKAHRYNLQQQAFPIKKVPQEIKDLYRNVMEHRYQFPDGDKMIENSVKSMYRVLRYIVKDSFGLKKLGYKILDKIFSKEDMYFSDLSMYHHIEQFDFLNQDHREWTHPYTGEVFDKSVFNLYEEAVLFATELIQYFDQYLEGNEEKPVNGMIQNLSFNKGIACDDPRPMNHYNIYRK
ncbi:MAG: hypothetical protein ACVCEJ_01115 [Candidatus Izemoplasmataceae bacterium]